MLRKFLKKKRTTNCKCVYPEYSKSPTYEQVPFRDHIYKSNLFVSPMNWDLEEEKVRDVELKDHLQ